MNCCGAERDTRFCPECGGRLGSPEPISDLLVELRRKERLARENQARRLAFAEVDKRDDEWGNRSRNKNRVYASTAERSANRYGIWADALERLIETAAGRQGE